MPYNLKSKDEVKIDISRACAFTGEREMKPEDINIDIFSKLLNGIIQSGYTIFLCGMARGFDLFAAEQVLKLKKVYPSLKLIACIPCPFQDKYFTVKEKKQYEEVLSLCDERILISHTYFQGCMLIRNRFMVDNSSSLIAYSSPRSEGINTGGTGYTLHYALSCKKQIYIV